MASISRPEEVLIRRQGTAGGWSFFESTQISVEATCLANGSSKVANGYAIPFIACCT